MVYFEIINEDGFQRICRVSFGEPSNKLHNRVKTPILVIPLNDFLLKINGYTEILKRNSNIMLQIFDLDQKIPDYLSHLNIICDLNSNYYKQDGNAEFIDYNSVLKKDTGILHIVTKNCPSIEINENFSNIMLDDFCEEIVEEIKKHSQNGEDFQDIGLGFNLNARNNLISQIRSITELINSYEIINKIKLIKLSGIFDNFMNYKEIIDAILFLRDNIPADLLLMASGKINPLEFSLISYLGFDLIDGTYLLYAGFSDLYYQGSGNTGMVWQSQIKKPDNIACSCESCLKLIDIMSKDPSEIDKFGKKIVNDLFALHNLENGINEAKKVRVKITSGTLRAYLEKKCMNSTFLISTLRYTDSLIPNPFVDAQTLFKKSLLFCTGSLSYYEPQIVRFRNLVEKNCYPDQETKICVFLPCSMGKPYSKSRSHRKFIKAIRSGAKGDIKTISQVIVTSPLGLIPREVEEVYPAAHYDISVTGDWDQEEIVITSRAIVAWINKLPTEIPLIVHLYGGYLKAFKNAKKQINGSRTYVFTSKLDELESAISNLLQKINSGSKNQLISGNISKTLSPKEKLIKFVADFQFGSGAGKLLIGSGVSVVNSRNPQFKEIYSLDSGKKIKLGTYLQEFGKINLSFSGAKRLAATKGNSIILNIKDIRGSTIFKPAVKKIDSNLCSGDNVIIMGSDEDFLGIGTMIVNASTAMKMRRGHILKIRKVK
ncbi:MAG: DUF5591 domain-containing protein [Promethearchaeota archaeon]